MDEDEKENKKGLIGLHNQEYQVVSNRANYFLVLNYGTIATMVAFLVGILYVKVNINLHLDPAIFIWGSLFCWQLFATFGLIMMREQYLATLYIEKSLRPMIISIIKSDEFYQYETFLRNYRDSTYWPDKTINKSIGPNVSFFRIMMEGELGWFYFTLAPLVFIIFECGHFEKWQGYLGLTLNVFLLIHNFIKARNCARLKLSFTKDS